MKKLYILIRNDLSRSQKTVQAVHAAAELLLDNQVDGWDNGTIVCLKVYNENDLERHNKMVSEYGLKCKYFLEPDIGNQKTALAFVSDKNLFPDLPLFKPTY